MDGLNLVLGVVGAASLLSSCLDCLKVVKDGKSFDEDIRKLDQELLIEGRRLEAWGKAFCDYTWADDPLLQGCIQSTLEFLLRSTKDAIGLRTKYNSSFSRIVRNNAIPSSKKLALLLPTSRTELPNKPRKRCRIHGGSIVFRTKWAVMEKTRLSGLTERIKYFVDSLYSLASSPLHSDVHETAYMLASFERHQYLRNVIEYVDRVLQTRPIGSMDETHIQAPEDQKAITATPAHSAERTSAFKEGLKALPDQSGRKYKGGSEFLRIESHYTMNIFVTTPEEVFHESIGDYGRMTKVHNYRVHNRAIPEEDISDDPSNAWPCSSIDRAQYPPKISEGASNDD